MGLSTSLVNRIASGIVNEVVNGHWFDPPMWPVTGQDYTGNGVVHVEAPTLILEVTSNDGEQRVRVTVETIS